MMDEHTLRLERTTGPSSSHILDEADEAIYLTEVLHLAEGQTEDALDSALEVEAAATGVQTTLDGMKGSWDNSLCDAIIASAAKQARYGSDGSQSSVSIHLISPRSSNDKTLGSTTDQTSVNAIISSERNSVCFSDYEKFLAKTNCSVISTPRSRNSSTLYFPRLSSERSSRTNSPPRKTSHSFRDGLRNFSLRISKTKPKDSASACIRCHKDLKHTHTLRSLPCSHIYCHDCLHDLVNQAILAESRMPPKCCEIPLPAQIVKSTLNHHEQVSFMKSFQQYSTPWEESVYCPSPACGEFVPRPSHLDPRHPFQLDCVECGTEVCTVCKQVAHGKALQCPLDYELESIRAGDREGWRRCFNCLSLVKAKQGGTTHITCRCMSKFCFSCGGVWDVVSGCPNNCYDEACTSTAKPEHEDAIHRSEQSAELQQHREHQKEDMQRFSDYEHLVKKKLWNKHMKMKVTILDRYAELEAEMTERHRLEISKMDNRHLTKEAELLHEQEQYRRVVTATLRHMETYCDRVVHASGSESDLSSRSSLASDTRSVLTEKDRHELRRQRQVRDDIPRRQESQINVLRGKQEKEIEELEGKQQAEITKLCHDKHEELKQLENMLLKSEGQLTSELEAKKDRLAHRWMLESEVIRTRLETSTGLSFASIPGINWPEPTPRPAALSMGP